jgi:hypothetical protein
LNIASLRHFQAIITNFNHCAYYLYSPDLLSCLSVFSCSGSIPTTDLNKSFAFWLAIGRSLALSCLVVRWHQLRLYVLSGDPGNVPIRRSPDKADSGTLAKEAKQLNDAIAASCSSIPSSPKKTAKSRLST